MKEWAIDIAVGAVLGYIAVMLTLAWFVDGAASGALLAAGMLLGVILARVRRQRAETQTPKTEP